MYGVKASVSAACCVSATGCTKVPNAVVMKSERAKEAEKAPCGETVVQKGFLGESVSSLPAYGFQVLLEQTLRGQRRNGLSQNTLLDNLFSTRRLLRSFGAPP